MSEYPEVVWDIETFPIVGLTYQAYKIDSLAKVLQGTRVMSVAWSEIGEKTIHQRALPDFPGYKPGIFNMDDRLLVKFIAEEVLGKAFINVAHNGKQFDLKVVYGRMFIHGMKPPPESILIDTKQGSSSTFRLDKNNLEFISQEIGGKPKVEHEGMIPLSLKCAEGDMKAWGRLGRYNRGDVAITKPVYIRMKPWIPRKFPNMNLINGTVMVCRIPGCNGTTFNRDGFGYNGVSRYQKLRCKNCGAPNRKAPETFPQKERPLIR